jgi:hypothetical protein
VQARKFFGSIFTHALAGGLVLAGSSLAFAETGKFKAAIARAEAHEQSYEWDKAFAAYDDAIKLQRDAAGLKDRQTTVLRRYWQEQRHKDIGYRKEVLSLEYAQALRLNATVFDTLIENSLPKTKISSGILLRKGIEELESALRDPGFVVGHLHQAKPAAVASFRDYLGRKKAEAGKLNRSECMKAIREVALAGQSSLELNPTVSLLELACGACYGIDEYTAYLTPTQFRDLNDTFKPAAATFIPSVQIDVKSMGIGYLNISHFQESTPQEVEGAFLTLNKEGMKGLVLDLRGNPGGLIEAAVEVARRFLATGVIASTENYDPKLSTVYHARNADAWTVPVVILVDGETASAAEVVAGALKDNGRARILGQPTYGKGSLQGLVKLPDAMGGLPTGGLRLTIARFFSPKGLPYAGQGVMPDLLVQPLAMDASDAPLMAAIDDLQRQLMR